MNNKVKFLRGTATEYEASTKDNDTFYYTTDDEKLYLGNKEITGGGVTIDDTLSDTSEHPVQNKVVNAALNTKANLTDIPTELPANGGNADTVDGKHASDFASEDDKYYLSTFNSTGIKYVGVHRIIAKHNVKNDGRFYLQDEDTHNVRVNYADGADTADTADTAGTLTTTASNICLRNLSSGTAAATWDSTNSTGNCPPGAWYGRHS